MILRRLLAAVLMFAGVAVAAPAAAVVTLYTDESTFLTATGGVLPSYGFPDLGEEGVNVAPFYQVGPAVFLGDIAVYNDGEYGNGQTYLGGNDGFIGAFFGLGTAAGFHIGTFDSFGDITITYNGDFVGLVSTTDFLTPVFVGLTGLEDFSFLTFEFGDCGCGGEGGSEIDILDFSTDAVALAVPEPATWALLIIGFGAVGSVMRRRLRAATSRA